MTTMTTQPPKFSVHAERKMGHLGLLSPRVVLVINGVSFQTMCTSFEKATELAERVASWLAPSNLIEYDAQPQPTDKEHE